MGLFSSKYNEIEKGLLEQYSQIFQTMGYPNPRKTVKVILDKAIRESKKAGHYDIPANMGDMLIGKQDAGVFQDAIEKFKQNLDKKRKEGVTDEDIQWWFNLNDVERRMMVAVDDIAKLALFTNCREEGLNEKEATKEVRKYHPIYGDPSDTTHTKGKDRPLPVELKDRINIYIEKKTTTDQKEYKKEIEESSTFNALIRMEIKKGNI